MTESIMRNTLVCGITLFILLLINKAAKNQKAVITENYSLHRLVNFYSYFSYTLIGLSIIAFIFIPKKDKMDLILASILCSFFLLGGVLIQFLRTRIWFKLNEEEISFQGIWREPISIKWNDVNKIKFSTWSSSIVFKDAIGNKVLAHAHLKGISKILEMIEKKKGLSKKDIKFPY